MKNKRTWLLEKIKSEAVMTANEYEPNKIRKKNRGSASKWIVDMRRIFMNAESLDTVCEIFWEQNKDLWPFQVGGMESGAIPLVTGIILKGKELGYETNGFFVRKGRKPYGLCRHVEGIVKDDIPILIVDDLVNSGDSIFKVAKVLDLENKKINFAWSVISFLTPGVEQKFIEKNIKFSYEFSLDETGLIRNPISHQDEVEMKTQWMWQSPEPNYAIRVPSSAPLCDEDFIYFGTNDGYFYCLHQYKKQQVWKFDARSGNPKGILSSPKIYKNLVIFGSYDGSVYALDKNTGEKVWSYDEAEFVGSSPEIAPDLDLVFIGLEYSVPGKRGSVIALDLKTGEKQWEYFVTEFLHSSPAYCKEEQLITIGSNDGIVFLFEAQTGLLKWKFNVGSAIKASLVFDLKRRQVIFGAHDGCYYGVALDSGTLNFKEETLNVIYSTPLIIDDHLFITSLDKKIYIYDLGNSKTLKVIETGARIMSSPVFIKEKNKIYFGNNGGVIYEISKNDFKIKKSLLTTERILTPISYSTKNKLFFALLTGGQIIAFREKT